MKYVASLRRFKYSEKTYEFLGNENHKDKLNKNFWKYCKETFEVENNTLPDFDKVVIEQYFRNILKMKGREKTFRLPSWMKTVNHPQSEFDKSIPTYSEISKIISKMKASGSPCLLDQVSVIVLKRYPIVRTILQQKSWKFSTNLQPVFAKVFSSLIHNRIYSFLVANKYIETNIQEGIWDNISGTIEHTEHLTHIINHARLHQRQVVVTLLDLRNAFGTVDHHLIQKVLEYHHIPEDVKCIVKSYYENYKIRIGIATYVTEPIAVKNGVLQGDCLSPLLFNMVVNTLIKCIDDDKMVRI